MEEKGSELNTRQLMDFLQDADGLQKFLEHGGDSLSPQSFEQYLHSLLCKYKMSIPQLILHTNLSKPFTYQLVSGVRTAGRDVVLRIAFALKLSVEEAQRLLTLSGNSVLYPKLRRDAAIIFCLHKKLSLAQAEELLADLQEKEIYAGGE